MAIQFNFGSLKEGNILSQKDENGEAGIKNYFNKPHQVPLAIKKESEKDFWKFPVDPVVSVKSKNTVIRRTVAKQNDKSNERRGSIKESWALDDYEIDISGVLISEDNREPGKLLSILLDYCTCREALLVESELFLTLGIYRIVIENYSFPFTKGLENQSFTIKAYSDDKHSLLI